MNPFEDSILRVLKGDLVVGAAFLVSDRLVATCAHVVESAGAEVGEKISLRSPDGKNVDAIVEPDFWRDPNAEDISILRSNEPLENIKPVTLGSSSGTKGHKFSTFGFPKKGQELSGGGEIIGQATIDGIKVLQLRSPEITSGFSGAPVFDEIALSVVGMVLAITPPDEYRRQGTTAFAVPSEVLHVICPELKLQKEHTGTEKELKTHKSILRKLKEQASLYGLAIPVHLSIQIEQEEDEIIHLTSRMNTDREEDQ